MTNLRRKGGRSTVGQVGAPTGSGAVAFLVDARLVGDFLALDFFAVTAFSVAVVGVAVVAEAFFAVAPFLAAGFLAVAFFADAARLVATFGGLADSGSPAAPLAASAVSAEPVGPSGAVAGSPSRWSSGSTSCRFSGWSAAAIAAVAAAAALWRSADCGSTSSASGSLLAGRCRLARLDEVRPEEAGAGSSDLPFDRLGLDDHAAAVAVLAGHAERLQQPGTDALAGHLHQPERGHLGDLVTGAVAAEALDESAQHEVAVGLEHHVDEVDRR